MSSTLHRSSKARRAATLAVAAASLSLAASACAAPGTEDSGGEVDRLQVMAPAAPGGGWDETARAMGAALEGEGLAQSVQISNVDGAGGTVGLAELANERSDDFLMVMGLVMVGAVETNESQATLEDTTPIARLTAEDEIVVVPADSPYRTIDDLVSDMQKRGRGVSIAGGSAGGTDHILAAMIARDAGVPIEDLNYIGFSGGGESLAALLGGKVSAGVSGVSEYAEQIEAGKLRALAVSGKARVPGIDAPTLKEAGIDVEFINWRGVVAPPGISDDAREQLTALVDQMHESKDWQQTLKRNDWDDTYLSGPKFDAFLESEKKVTHGVLEDLGLVQ